MSGNVPDTSRRRQDMRLVHDAVASVCNAAGVNVVRGVSSSDRRRNRFRPYQKTNSAATVRRTTDTNTWNQAEANEAEDTVQNAEEGEEEGEEEGDEGEEEGEEQQSKSRKRTFRAAFGTPIVDDDEEQVNTKPMPASAMEFLQFRTDIRGIDYLAGALYLRSKHRASEDSLMDQLVFFRQFLTKGNSMFPCNRSNFRGKISNFLEFKPVWSVYCMECDRHLDRIEQLSPPTSYTCQHCGRDLKYDLKKGIGLLCTFPLKKQVQSFQESGGLETTMDDYKKFSADEYRGEVYDKIMKANGLPISVASDGIALTKDTLKTIHPVVCYFENLPPNFKHRLFILLNIYCGLKTTKIPLKMQYKSALREIDEYNEDPLPWSDGVKRKLYILFANADAPEKGDSMCHIRFNGHFGCLYCEDPGESVPGGGVRWNVPVHIQQARTRTERRRMKQAKQSLAKTRQLLKKRNKRQSGDANQHLVQNNRPSVPTINVKPVPVMGVKGKPFIRDRRFFDVQKSSVPDMLHLVYLGTAKVCARFLVGKVGSTKSLLHSHCLGGKRTYSTSPVFKAL